MFGLCLSQGMLTKRENFVQHGDRIPNDQMPTYRIPKSQLDFTFQYWSGLSHFIISWDSTGIAISTGIELKSCLGQIFNFKLDSFTQ